MPFSIAVNMDRIMTIATSLRWRLTGGPRATGGMIGGMTAAGGQARQSFVARHDAFVETNCHE